MFVSYLILTLLHVQTAVLARPGGEVSQIKYLVRSCIFVSTIFLFLSTKRDQVTGFLWCAKSNALYCVFRHALPFLTERLLFFLKKPVISKISFGGGLYSCHTGELAWPWWQMPGGCTFLLPLQKKKMCTSDSYRDRYLLRIFSSVAERICMLEEMLFFTAFASHWPPFCFDVLGKICV